MKSGFGASWRLALAVLLVAATAASAGGLAEFDLGLNLFDLYGQVELDYHNSDADISKTGSTDFSSKVFMPFGFYVAYTTPQWAIGGELAFLLGRGHMQEFTAESDNHEVRVDGGTVLMRYTRLGPQFRYFFSDAKIKPYIGGALAYVNANIDPPGVNSTTVSQVDIGFLGGVLVQVHPLVAIGGSGRLDYYAPIELAEWHGVADEHADDTLKAYLHWAPFSIYFNTAVTF